MNSQVAKLVNAATVSTLKKSLKDREYRCYASSNLALATKQIKEIQMNPHPIRYNKSFIKLKYTL